MGEICDPPDLINALDVPCGGTPTENHPILLPAGWSACTSADDGMGPYYFPAGLLVCGADDTQPCHLSLSAEAPTVQSGFCNPSGGQATVTPAKWDGYGRACGGALTTGKGCNINQICLPKPPIPYVPGVCIKRPGDFNCPAGLFDTKHIFYDDFTDSRTCTGCQCGGSAGATCAGNLSVYADSTQNQCLSPVSTFAAGTCADINGNPAVGNSKFTVTSPPSGGSCPPSGAMPSGAATKTFPQTFCCIE